MKNAADKPVILVAEDDLVSRQVIVHQLGLLGYTAAVAANGAQALRLWRDGGYGLLLTDLEMPVMDGHRLAERIRHEEAGRGRLPILALTATPPGADAERLRQAGFDACLTKPVQLDTLANALARWLTASNMPAASSKSPAAIGAATSAPVLDLTVLHALVGGAAPLAANLLEVCEESLGGLQQDFDDAFARADVQRVAWLAHQLKSTSRAIGAARLGDLCAELAGLGSRPGGTPLPVIAVAFMTALTDVQRAIAVARRPPCPAA